MNWISVDDQMPESHRTVMVGGLHAEGYRFWYASHVQYIEETGEWWDTGFARYLNGVTHWLVVELPK